MASNIWPRCESRSNHSRGILPSPGGIGHSVTMSATIRLLLGLAALVPLACSSDGARSQGKGMAANPRSQEPTTANVAPETKASADNSATPSKGSDAFENVLGFSLDLARRHVFSARTDVGRMWSVGETAFVHTTDNRSGRESLVPFHGASLRPGKAIVLRGGEDNPSPVFDVDPVAKVVVLADGNKLRIISLVEGAAGTPRYEPLSDSIESLRAIPGLGVVVRTGYDSPLQLLQPGKAPITLAGSEETVYWTAAVSPDGAFLAWVDDGDVRRLHALSLTGGEALRQELAPWESEYGGQTTTSLHGFVSSNVLAFFHGNEIWQWNLKSDQIVSIAKGETSPLATGASKLIDRNRWVKSYSSTIIGSKTQGFADGRIGVLVRHPLDGGERSSLLFGYPVGPGRAIAIEFPWTVSQGAQLVLGKPRPRILVGSERKNKAALLDSNGKLLFEFSEPCDADDEEDGACGAKVLVAGDRYAVVEYLNLPTVVYSLESGKELHRVEQHDDYTQVVAIGGMRILVGSIDVLRCLDLATLASCGERRGWWPKSDEYPPIVGLSPDSDTILIHNGKVRLYSLGSGRLLRTLALPRKGTPPTDVAFTKDGAIIVTIDDSNDDASDAVDIVFEANGKLRWQDTTRSGLLRRVGDGLFSGVILRNLRGEAVAEFVGAHVSDWRRDDSGVDWLLGSSYPNDSKRLLLVRDPLGAIDTEPK